MADHDEKESKIFVDSDWKEQARREKEELDRQAREAEAQEPPEASIIEVIQILVMQASIGLGGFQDPQTGQQPPPNLPLAKHYIDLLAILGDKSKGNLTDEEQKILDGTLHELRMAFVQVASALGAMPDTQKKAQ